MQIICSDDCLEQLFPTTFLDPQHCIFPCHLNQTHLIQIIISLVETPRPEMGVPDKGEMQNVQCCRASMNVVGNHWPKILIVLTSLRNASFVSLTTSFTLSFSPFTIHSSELFVSICRCCESTVESSWFISCGARHLISSGEKVCVEHWLSYARSISLQALDTSASE